MAAEEAHIETQRRKVRWHRGGPSTKPCQPSTWTGSKEPEVAAADLSETTSSDDAAHPPSSGLQGFGADTVYSRLLGVHGQ